jgi:hypothetical protein
MRDKKKTTTRRSAEGTGHMTALFADIHELILAARRAVVRSVDTLQVLASFETGRHIGEHEQQGAARTEYGKVGASSVISSATEW